MLSRWTMELAALLREQYQMERKTAMELAHLTRELLTRLGTGRVWFDYQKDDGTVREAVGTLCPGVSAGLDGYELKSSRRKCDQWPTETFCYWDLEREGFRTFRASRLIKIKAATIVNGMHSSIMH